MNSILHIVPAGIVSCRYDGTYKDIMGRVRFLESSGVDYLRILVSEDNPVLLDDVLRRSKPTHVLVEYTYFRRILMSLRTRLPDAFIAARAINIEPLQHLDNHGLFPRRGPVWLLYGMLRLGVSDVTHRRKADAIYPISEWEGRVYWRRLPGGSCVKWVPYFSPDFVLSGRHGERKEQLIACVPGSASYPRNKDAVVRFLKFAEIARRVAPDYRFVITGDLRDSGIAVPGFVEVPGLIEDVAELLGAAKAVAVLSPRGYGFKTTVADAVANGCYALVHPLQYARGPVVLRDGCIPLDAITHCSVERTLERLDKPFPSFQGNAHLRDRAIEVLRHDFLSTKNG